VKRDAVNTSITVVIVSTKIFTTDKKVVVSVQLPELAVDDIEVFIGEKVCYLVDIVLVL